MGTEHLTLLWMWLSHGKFLQCVNKLKDEIANFFVEDKTSPPPT